MSVSALHASIFVLYERSPTTKALDLWEEILSDLIGAIPDRYAAIVGRHYRVRINDTLEASPDGKFVRYRTLNASLRMRRDAPALLDLALGNWIFSTSDLAAPLATSELPGTAWVRSTTSIPLAEHTRWINEAVIDLEEAGWELSPAELKPLTLSLPMMETAGGIRPYSPSGLSRMVGQTLWIPPATVLGVLALDENARTCQNVAGRLEEAWQRTFRMSSPPVESSLDAPLQGRHVATLLVIPDAIDLTARPDLLDRIRMWEQADLRFKLARQSTTAKPYPLQNLCFDLANLAGAMHWRPENVVAPSVSFDAGHDATHGRSRWACAVLDEELRVTGLRVIDTPLAEHMPTSVSDAFWPADEVRQVFRDGRLSKERQLLDAKAFAEKKILWEVKKHPVPLIFSGEMDAPLPAVFGDALVDPHGEILLQTLPSNKGDTIHPIRVRSSQVDGDVEHAVTDLLAYCMTPSLSMYQQSRLPGPVYWADLASKLDRTGWSQVIGRGFGLASTIPFRGT